MFDGRSWLCVNSVTTCLKKSGQLICNRTRVIDISESAYAQVVYLLVSMRIYLATVVTRHFQISCMLSYLENSVGCDYTG